MIIDKLQQGLDLLETRLENMPDRHRSIRAVFDQSWRLLSEEEQTVFKKLAVFRGGFSWEAAAFVSEASLFIMSNLVDKAFLRVDGEGRYHLHSLVRQYAEEKLRTSPEDYATTRDQHCHYYCEFLHQRYDIWYMYEQNPRDEIEAELDNIRYALDWSIERQAAHQLVMAMSTFCGFCNVESLWQEAHRLFGRVVTSFRQTNHTDVLWRALAFQGWFAQSLGDYEQSTERYTEALAIGRKFGWDSFNIDKGFLDHRLCEQAMRQGNIATAKYHADEVKLINDIPDKPYAMTWVLELKGRVSHLEGDYEQAIVFLQDALSLARTFDSIIATIVILTDLGNVYLNLSDYAMAKQSFEESLLVCKGLYYLHGTTWALIGLGIATHHLGNYHDALSYFCEALETARKTGEALGKLHTLIGIADLWITQGKEADALEFLLYTHQHPAAEWDTRRQAQKIMGELESKLPNEVFAQATERAKILELDNIVETILAEHGNEKEQMSSTTTDYPESNLAANQALFEPLTKRELEILHLLASGHTNQEIANQLFIAASTVTKHCSNIFGKLDVRSRTKAIRRARELNLL